MALLNSFSANYFQKVLDDFGANTLTITTLCIYGFVLVIICGLNYIDEYPSCKLSESIYLDLKLKALRKMSTIEYKYYQSLGTGNLVQKIENGGSSGKSILFDFYFKLFWELIPSIVFSLIFIASIDKNIMIYIGIGYIFVFIVTNILLKYLYNIKAHILNNEENFNKYLIRGFMELVVFRTNKRFKDEISKFKNVCFSYEEKNIFKNLSFNIAAGSSVTLVGESGSGKSTIVKQIIGLLKVDKGNIYIDNNDLSEINLNHFYNYVSYTSQESPIFDETLRENIVFDKEISDNEIIEALKGVGLVSFYSSLSKGLDTEVGEKGIMLSGGERQRLSLARVFFMTQKLLYWMKLLQLWTMLQKN
ncbi:lipid A export ATP-binding/permease protein MsbA [Clostridium puniceum]|uniref:Lipid A export ATP-binding/permease protein MsbA n=1 Tax=Clostridium puniceum TaxID=29367 RepID=A0A1S8TAZ1_9CLOT|nr:lipid A export ATP-binding/permease protein MsbA [Clostridium puniceum]